MNLLKKIILWFLVILVSFTTTYALSLQWDIKLDEAKSNSLKISWDKVDEAVGYFVYYDTVSHADDKKYSNSLDDMIDWTWATITKLEPNTDYYVAIRVVDWDWNEWDFSNEYKFTTAALENLKITSVNVIDENNISVVFNTKIDSSKDVEFKITQKDNNLSEIWIDSTNVDWNTVNIKLSDSLNSNQTYTLTVVSLTWINGEVIDAWVDWVIDFTTWELVPLNSASDTWTTSTWVTDTNNLNSASDTWTTMSWTNLSDSQIKKTAELAGAKTKKLPKTWPESWILVIAALLLAFWIIKFRKQA